MKKRFFAALCVSMCAASVWAQGIEDALRFNQHTLQGTARAQAMGGAFGAVGADLTSSAINPAGMGLYRATEFAFSLGVNAVNNETKFFDSSESETKVRVPLNQLGINFSVGKMRQQESGIYCASSNFFINYNRTADYASKQVYSDPFSYNSLLDYFCFDEQKEADLTGGLAYEAYLTYDTVSANGYGFSYNVWEELVDGELNPFFREDEHGLGLVNMRKRVETSGSNGDIAFGYAANISNKFYIGGSVNMQTLLYEENVSHSESFEGWPVYDDDPLDFSYASWLRQDGFGVNFKLGVIYRPISPLRLGFAIHSPSFFKITDSYNASIYNPAMRRTYQTETFDYQYRFQSPSRFVASAAYVIGRAGLISVDYEHTNYKHTKFTEINDNYEYHVSGDVFEGVNKAMKNDVFQGASTLRIGAEVSVLNPIYLRAGYRYSSSPVKKDTYIAQPTDYGVSGGLGFRVNNFFADLTYVCNVKKDKHWVLPDSEEQYIYETNAPADRTQKSRNVALTVGFRF